MILNRNTVEKIESPTPEFFQELSVQELDFFENNKVKNITDQSQGLSINFTYDQNDSREKTERFHNNSLIQTKLFINGLYEVELDEQENERKIHYINAGNGVCAIYVEESSESNLYYIHKDYLGSIYAITDETGNIVRHENTDQVYSFDPWGRRRNATDWTYDNIPSSFLFDRGFTGHEHLDGFSLINMNARLYDPKLGRFLSPDNYVQEASSTGSLNRYTYCLNNPLIYTDPSGDFIWMPVIIGAAIGGFSGWQIGHAAGAEGWSMVGYIAGGALIGGVSGGTASAISSAGGGAFISCAVGGAIGNGSFTALAGGDANAIAKGVFTGFVSGGVGGSIGAAIGGGGGAFAGGAVGSGLNAKLNGASWEQAGIAALAGGTMAFGAYHASSYLSWKFGGGNNLGGHDISYRQHSAMQADFQRSRFWNKEYGGYLLEGGGVHRSGPGTSSQVDLGSVPAGEVAFAEYHTHWDKPGITRYVLSGGDGTYVDPAQIARETPIGQRVALDKFTTSRYHGDWDYNTGGRPSFVINRYDGSYYSGSGTNYSVINPPINRFIYSFFFWR